jgi:hypothetical protein
MKKSLILLVTALSLFAADIATIGFDQSWILEAGATINSDKDTLTIVGDPSSSVIATLTTNVTTSETLYLVADVHFSSDVQGKPDVYYSPRFKLYNGADDTKISILNFTDPLLDKWYTTGLMVTRFQNFGASSLKIEFLMQQTTGTMTITNPRLVDTPPEAIYKFPYPVPADKSCKIAIVSGELRPFPSHLLSVNSHFVWATGGWEDPALRTSLKDRMPLGNLRFPGGTVGNFYDWSTDGFYGDSYTFESPSRQNGYEDGFKFGFEDYASLCLESGATSTLMFNVINDSPDKAASRLQNRIDAGLTVDVIELGNENFFSEQAMGNIAETDHIASVDAYIYHTKAMTTALKAVDPDIKVAVNIDRHSWGGEWNSAVASETYYDGTIVHPYVKVNGFLFNEASAKEILASYREIQDNLTNYEAGFGTTPLYCTEWSVLSDGIPINFLQVLGVGDLMFGLIEGNDRGIVKQLGIHMLYQNDKYVESTLYFREDGTITRTQLGVFYEKVTSLFTGSSIYTALGKSGDIDTGIPGVLARAIVKGDSTKIIVINKLPESSPLEITIDGESFAGDYTMESFAEPLLSDLKGYPLDSNPWTASTGTGTPSIPAYSVTIVSFLTDTPDETAVNKSISLVNKAIRVSQSSGKIQLSNTQNYQSVSIYSLLGRELYSQSIVGMDKVQIQSANLSMGSYIIKLRGKTNFTKKILIR